MWMLQLNDPSTKVLAIEFFVRPLSTIILKYLVILNLSALTKTEIDTD